jgi:hypothetical protein
MQKGARQIRGICLLLLLFSGRALLAALPDWVRQAASQTLPAYDPETDAVVLLDDVQFTVTDPESYVEHYRRVVKILRPEGRTECELAVYSRQREKVLSLHAWSIDRTGREYELKEKDFVERGYFSGYELYSDIRLRTATAPAADPGSVIALEYEVRRHPWLNQVEWTFQESIPVLRSQVTMQLPPGWETKPSWAGVSPIPIAQTAPNLWEWTLLDLPAIEPEDLRPPLRALSARLSVAYFAPGEAANQAGSWDALGRWYGQLTAGRRNPSAALNQKVVQVTAGISALDATARALASFVQTDVRYVAIEIGIGGFQPHPADDIFRARYGDCKDKATLLSAMLHEAGIASNYVLIDTYRGIVNPDVPSAAFNHAILAIELPNDVPFNAYPATISTKTGKRYLIFDPTDAYTPFGNLRGQLQDTYALLVNENGGELIHIPLFPPSSNLLARTGHFVLGHDGALSGEIVERRSGDHAARERAAFLHADQRQRIQLLEQQLSRSLKGFEVADLQIEQLDQPQQDLVIKYKLSAPDYTQIRGPLMLLRPRVVGQKGFGLETKPRHYPFQFADTSTETDTYEIDLPQGYVVDDAPDPVLLDLDFASYQSKVEVLGSKVRYTREFVRKADSLPTSRIDELRRFLGAIAADESSVVILKQGQ